MWTPAPAPVLASPSISLSSVELAPHSKRGLGADFFETMAALSLNVLATGALSISGGQALSQMVDFGNLWGTAYYLSTLALGPLGTGTADFVFGDPRGALARVIDAYRWTAISAGMGAGVGTVLAGPGAGAIFTAFGAVPIGLNVVDGAFTAVQKKWAREASTSASLPVTPAHR